MALLEGIHGEVTHHGEECGETKCSSMRKRGRDRSLGLSVTFKVMPAVT